MDIQFICLDAPPGERDVRALTQRRTINVADLLACLVYGHVEVR